MIKAIIVDDEPSARRNLTNLLEKCCPNIKVEYAAASAKDALRAIHSYEPEIVFLDIEMPNENGFDLLEQIPEIDFEVIFITAYDKYAIRAIRFSALDYLLKPIDENELKDAVNKAEEKISSGSTNKSNMNALFENLQSKNKNPVKMAVPDATGYDFIEVKNIMRIEGASYKSNLILADKRILLVQKTLKELEEMLGDDFCRVHNSHIINLNYAVKFIKGDGGGYVRMTDGKEVEVSRRKKDEVLQRMSVI